MPPSPETVEQAFLDDIVAHPEDPSLWLILADWLDEREDPRAELVRLNWSLRHERDHADFPAREARVQALLADGTLPVMPRLTLQTFEFTWIPPGTFLMGSPEEEANRNPDEDQHIVTLPAGFWLGTYEVTQQQYLAVMGTNPAVFTKSGSHQERVKRVRNADLLRFPVETVSWDDANEFAAKLGTVLGRVARLPTETEWEYACRAGTTSPFCFGSILNGKQANVDGNYPYGTEKKGRYLRRPQPVGCYPPNPFGLYDMHGNVWEWTSDLHKRGSRAAKTGPRVVKGGSWDSFNRNCRAAYRNDFPPSTRNNVIGLRVLLPA
jgi:uncharacterized protein (TIGR02996 family)